MYTALYRTERPEVFSEIIGQDHIVRILKNQINTDTVSHAYLFCGTRGTGKTTTARILAKAVNCLDTEDVPCGHCANCMSIKEGTFMDVIEIDAASNNGVDNIRELRESVKYPPAVGRKKVYIIDEVHMLTIGAFNALLKTLEEPPENVMFILATTDPQKLPQTILSRCMRLDFKRVPDSVLVDHMREICSERGISITEGALRLLAANADGSVRDGLSILDQCLSGGDREIDRDLVLEFLGTVSEEFFIELTEKVALHDVSGALLVLDRALSEGKDVKQIMKDWMAHYRCLLISKYIKNAEDMLNMSAENLEKLRDQGNRISIEEINNGILTLSRTINDARYSTQPRILLELAIVTIATGLMQGGQTVGTQTVTKQQTNYGTAGTPQVSRKPVQAVSANGISSAKAVSSGESVEKTTQKTGGPGEYTEEELNDIWNQVFEEGESKESSFNLFRLGSRLVGINEKEFKVIVNNEIIQKRLYQSQDIVCDIMEKIIGRRLRLVCHSADQEEKEDNQADMERLARQVEDKLHLGIPVKVE